MDKFPLSQYTAISKLAMQDTNPAYVHVPLDTYWNQNMCSTNCHVKAVKILTSIYWNVHLDYGFEVTPWISSMVLYT